jgi:integrase
MVKFVEGSIARLAVPAGEKELVIFDEALPGFGVRKFAGGKASFFVKYRVAGKQRKLTLGPVAPGNLAEMRRAAADVMAKARAGQDVAEERKAASAATGATLGELVPRFLLFKHGKVSAEYHYQLNLFLNRYWAPLHGVPVEALRRGKIVALLDQLVDAHGATGADRAAAALSSFFAWAIERSYVELSPVIGISRRATGGARERVLTKAELIAVWNAAGDFDYAAIVRLLILTGQRKSEIGNLEWSEVDFERKQIALGAGRTKNKRAHILPLNSAALEILRAVPRRSGRQYVFGDGARGYQGWSKAKERLDARLPADMPHWTLHDLRRSVGTHLNEEGLAEPHIVEAILNHVSGSKSGVAGVYNRAAYAKQKRQALDLWGAWIGAALAGRESNVIDLKLAKGQVG